MIRASKLLVLLAVLFVLGGPAETAAALSPPRFQDSYVDTQLGGGEPSVIETHEGTLVYTAHEGTTHLYRPGLTSSLQGDSDWLTNYRNQVNIWYSVNGGQGWQRASFDGTGFFQNPAQNTGFSDPDLTLDGGGRVYDTGIDLANDALFSSPDGGRNWDAGTPQCHDGDRPWLAGAGPNTVYLATDTAEGQGSGHQVYVSTDGGNTCSAKGISDSTTFPDGSGYSGYGKIHYYKPADTLIEPAEWYDKNSTVTGVGVSILPHVSSAFQNGGAFHPVQVAKTTVFGHWPAITIDHAGNIYLVWDTNPRRPNTKDACGNTAPLPNSIMMAVSKDGGYHWSRPKAIATPGTTVLWPWVVAGRAGSVSVVWYQSDRVVDVDCQPSNIYVYDAQIFGANTSRPHGYVVNASGRPITQDNICQGGTGCVATGKDRRLGDYLTNNLDYRGCLLIATGDTMLTDPMGNPYPTSRPLLIRQTAGLGLYGVTC